VPQIFIGGEPFHAARRNNFLRTMNEGILERMLRGVGAIV
jgi:hypothetical protein